MSDLIKKILVYSCIVIGVLLIFYILRYIYKILTDYDPMIQKTISNNENLQNFHNHIGKVTLNSTDSSESYFQKYNVKKSYGNYINVYLYNNIFDKRLFSSDEKGNFYKNLSNTFTK
jgi:hypothetical protein